MRGSNPRLLAHKTNTLPTELMELFKLIPSITKNLQKGCARVEPATYRAATDCSTTELTPRWCNQIKSFANILQQTKNKTPKKRVPQLKHLKQNKTKQKPTHKKIKINQKKVLPGLEPGLQGSKPWVLTNYTIEPRCDP